MNIEHHYYQTYLTLVASGVEVDDAKIIAYSAQYIDDNVAMCHIDVDRETYYHNYISQTQNLFLPRKDLRRIFPIFHFLPRTPDEPAEFRKDHRTHHLLCTPNNKISNAVVDDAIEEGNLYRIGIALHSYSDTFAHQQWTGTFHDINDLPTWRNWFLPHYGHAKVYHDPDLFTKQWIDPRLVRENIDNVERFIDAIRHVYKKMSVGRKPRCSIYELVDYFYQVSKIEKMQDRIEKYQLDAIMDERFGKVALPEYNRWDWFEDAVIEKRRLFRDAIYGIGLLSDSYYWRNRDNYMDSHWYQFQQQIKKHQYQVIDILNDHGIDIRSKIEKF